MRKNSPSLRVWVWGRSTGTLLSSERRQEASTSSNAWRSLTSVQEGLPGTIELAILHSFPPAWLTGRADPQISPDPGRNRAHTADRRAPLQNRSLAALTGQRRRHPVAAGRPTWSLLRLL